MIVGGLQIHTFGINFWSHSTRIWIWSSILYRGNRWYEYELLDHGYVNRIRFYLKSRTCRGAYWHWAYGSQIGLQGNEIDRFKGANLQSQD